MKKRSWFVLVALAVLLSLALTGPAGATDGVGFDIDCEGAYGYGSVAANDVVWWDITLWDPISGWLYFDGIISGGETGAPFDPEVVWPVEIIPGTDLDTSHYWVYIKGELVAEDHFECEPPPPCGEGCTPGFWRQPQHLDSWTGYTPGDDFDTVFGTDYFDPDITLLDAAWLGGGGVKKLARHGTAALLNASSPDVGYPLTVSEVIAAVQAGDAKTLAEYNELGCPID